MTVKELFSLKDYRAEDVYRVHDGYDVIDFQSDSEALTLRYGVCEFSSYGKLLEEYGDREVESWRVFEGLFSPAGTVFEIWVE